MTQIITEGTEIDFSSGTQHIECDKLETFKGSIVPLDSDKEQAVKMVSHYINTHREISFWKGVSCLDTSRTGVSIAWYDLG